MNARPKAGARTTGPRGSYDFNPLTLVAILVDGFLNHQTILDLMGDETIAWALTVGIAVQLYAFPQMAANMWHRGRRVQAGGFFGVIGIIVWGMLAARMEVGVGGGDAGIFGSADDTSSSNLIVAAIMGFVMVASALLGFFGRLSSLEAADADHAEGLRAELMANRAERAARDAESALFSFDEERAVRAALQEAEAKKRQMRAYRDLMKSTVSVHMASRFPVQADAREFVALVLAEDASAPGAGAVRAAPGPASGTARVTATPGFSAMPDCAAPSAARA